MTEWIDRTTALARLGVRAQTLYAYASRGRIGRKPDPADPRRSLYRADDVALLDTRRARGRRPATIAASAIAWGEPAIDTTISTVVHGRLIYRGQDAAALAMSASLEEVAALIWERTAPVCFDAPETQASDAYVALAKLVAGGRPTIGRSADRLCADAARAVATLAAALGADGDLPLLHQRLGRAWALDDAGTDRLRRAMVMMVDHELNPSTFATRVTASTGASIAACLLSGLSALSGPRHGLAGLAVATLVEDAARHGVEPAIERWLVQERPLPGFGHPLYPDGDPRCTVMLDGVAIDDDLAALRTAVFDATGALPNCDFALAVLTRTLRLRQDAPFRLFAIARGIGWAAHAIEQATGGGVIRPRATYRGIAPVE